MTDDEIASELDCLKGKMIDLLVEGMINLKISSILSGVVHTYTLIPAARKALIIFIA